MDLTWLQSLVLGAVSGFTEILPVSAQAHRLLLRKLFGTQAVSEITLLLVHVGILAAVYLCCQNQILRIARAVKLSKIPKKKRKRPLDALSLLDFSLFKSMALPLVIALIFMNKIMKLENNLVLVSVFLIANGIILYVPQFFATGNKDARMLSRIEGLLIGLGCATSALPGISGIGAAFSVASICGVDHTYALNMSLLLEIVLLTGLIVMDIMTIVTTGLIGLSFWSILISILAAAAAYGTTILAIRCLRKIASEYGLVPFSYYCWVAALFSLMLTMFA